MKMLQVDGQQFDASGVIGLAFGVAIIEQVDGMHAGLRAPFVDLEQYLLHGRGDLAGRAGDQKVFLDSLTGLFQAGGYPRADR